MLHEKMQASFFLQNMENSDMETICRITMQLQLFQLKLETIFFFFHRRDNFVLTRKFFK